MQVLVIGGAGYIGSHVVRAFLDQGHTVTVFDDLSTGARGNLFTEAAFFEGDIRNPDDLADAIDANTFDGVVHLAAFKQVGESMSDPGKYAINNLSGTVHVLNAMADAGLSNLVFSSSAAVFGEPQYLPVDEAHPTNPESFYGYTKLEMERLMAWYDRLKGVRYAAMRYFNAAGYDPQGRVTGIERGAANLLPVLMEVAIGQREQVQVFGTDYDTRDGSCIRDYIHVSDLASAHVMAMEHLVKGGDSHVFNLGTAQGATVLEMLEKVREVTGHPIPAELCERRAGDPSTVYADSQKIREVLGWRPQHSDIDTIVRTAWVVYERSGLSD